MSDGPHRSLPMPRGWKKVAEYAGNETFASDDVRDALVTAIEQDWRKDISPSLIGSIQDVLGGATLFSEDRSQVLEDLRQSVAGCTMGNVLLDHMVYTVSDGTSGDTAFQEAVTQTATDWSARCARQVEEHYLRKSSTENAAHVRSRIEEAMQKAPFTALASRLLDTASRPAPRLVKHDGLDDGVRL
ncbi:MAG: hypothetical protein HYZ81_24575 [Nitrospinae bacterium]|nr:hypothetical protein [Nitrospinota bacterium]